MFHFDKLKIKCEVVEDKAFTDAPYPESVYDVVDYILRECIKKEQPIRKCNNCKKYFEICRRTDTKYCSHAIDDMGRTCCDLGASYLWERKKKDDEVFNFTDGNIKSVLLGSRARKSLRKISMPGLKKQGNKKNCVIVERLHWRN